MGRGHAHALYVHEHSGVHGLASEAKLVAAILAVFAVAVTPRQAVWAFALYASVVAVTIVISRVGLKFVLSRLLGVVPFVLFALVIPFVSGGEEVEVLGMSLSLEGLWGTWNILAKALLGASISILLTATTEVPEIVRAMGVVRVPAIFTSIAMFMIRYLELVSDELSRMRVAMTSRGFDPRWLSQARPIASGAGAMFVRSYERGERVHAAMVSRGFSGTMPDLGRRSASGRDWMLCSGFVFVFVAISALALVLT